jgi:UDP-N-acetylglucosamine acyltransferase
MSVSVHPTAIVSTEAELGENVSVGPYCIVDGQVRIGSGTVLNAFVRIRNFVEIGEACHLEEHVTLGGEPQDFGFKGEETWVRIGSGVVFRENVTVHRATGEGNSTIIGDRAYLMEGSHVGHNARVGNDVVLANKVGLAGYVTVGDRAVLGGMAGVHQFVHIGRFCMIGGLSKIVKDVPPFTMADGRPARLFGLNKVGLRRNGFDAAARGHLLSLYKELYQSGLPFRKACALLAEKAAEDSFVEEIAAFVAASKRGLTSWTSSGRHSGAGERNLDD